MRDDILLKDGNNKVTENAEAEQGLFTAPMDLGKRINRDKGLMSWRLGKGVSLQVLEL